LEFRITTQCVGQGRQDNLLRGHLKVAVITLSGDIISRRRRRRNFQLAYFSLLKFSKRLSCAPYATLCVNPEFPPTHLHIFHFFAILKCYGKKRPFDCAK
jgi:hypothetical protein